MGTVTSTDVHFRSIWNFNTLNMASLSLLCYELRINTIQKI